MVNQSIIVYRNPLEAAMWETLMESNAVFPVMVGVAVFFGVFILFDKFITRPTRSKWNRSKWNQPWYASSNFGLAVAFTVAASVVAYML